MKYLLLGLIFIALVSGCTSGPPVEAVCGDGICNGDETWQTCFVDCEDQQPQGYCGDGHCDLDESPQNCPMDCPVSAICGNGICETGEDSSNCPMDCEAFPQCGDGVCDPDENYMNCAQDCPPPDSCGDGVCAQSEHDTCLIDCNACILGAVDCGITQQQCLDGVVVSCQNICEPHLGLTYSCIDCVPDCTGHNQNTFCGDGICNGDETEVTCPEDCTLYTITLIPTADAYVHGFGWHASDGRDQNYYQLVDEYNPNTGDYIWNYLDAGDRAYFGLTGTALSGFPERIIVRTYAKRYDSAHSYGRIGIQLDGEDYRTPLIQYGSSYRWYEAQWEYNPATGQPWTWPEINRLAAGVTGANSPGSTGSYHAAIQVIVDYRA